MLVVRNRIGGVVASGLKIQSVADNKIGGQLEKFGPKIWRADETREQRGFIADTTLI